MNLQNKYVVLALFVLALIFPITTASLDNQLFDVSVCSSPSTVFFSECALFSGWLNQDSLLEVPSFVIFRIQDDSLQGDFCRLSVLVESGTVDSVRFNSEDLLERISGNDFKIPSFTEKIDVSFSTTNAQIRGFSITCEDSASAIVVYQPSVSTPTSIEAPNRLVLTSRPKTNSSFGVLVEVHTFSGITASSIDLSSTSFPSFCVRSYPSTTTMRFTCTQRDAFENYQISFVPLAEGSLTHSFSGTYTNLGLSEVQSLLQRTISVFPKPSLSDVGIPTKVLTQRGIVEMRDLRFLDTLLSMEVACPSSSSASILIGNKDRGFTCEFFSNQRQPNGFFEIQLNQNSLITSHSSCQGPFSIAHSGVYTIRTSCNFEGEQLCSGFCLNPLASPLPSTIEGWRSFLQLGRTFFSFSNNNQVPDCVCTGSGVLEPISLYTNPEPFTVRVLG